MTILEHLENERSCIAEALSITGQAQFGLPFDVDLNYEVLSGWLALVELARLAGVVEEDLSPIVTFVGDDPFQEVSYDQDTFPVGGREALEGLQRLIDRVRPLVERLVAMEQKGTLFVLVNPAGAICMYNDYGAYANPWDALRDLAEVKRENPRIYLSYVQRVNGAGKLCPQCGHPIAGATVRNTSSATCRSATSAGRIGGSSMAADLSTATSMYSAILGAIARFQNRAAEEQYTDTGDAWDLLDLIEQMAKAGLEEGPGDGLLQPGVCTDAVERDAQTATEEVVADLLWNSLFAQFSSDDFDLDAADEEACDSVAKEVVRRVLSTWRPDLVARARPSG